MDEKGKGKGKVSRKGKKSVGGEGEEAEVSK